MTDSVPGSGNSRFEYVIYIRATAAELWRGLTAPEMTRQYWCETWQDCEWKIGAPWRLMTPDLRVGDAGEVLEIEPERRLVISWRHELMPEFRTEGYSRCALLLEPVEGAMKLSLTHEIEKADSKLIAAFATGWPPILSSLKSLLETGESLENTRKWPEGM